MSIFNVFDAHHNGACWQRTPGQEWPADLSASSMDEAVAEVEDAISRLAAADVPPGVIIVEVDDDGDEIKEEVVDLR